IKKPFLCNGANLAYKKELFKTLNGFQGNTEIASGDDVFLLEKATRNKAMKVAYLKCEQAVVLSSALTSRKDLIEQRVRWAAKSSAYKNLFGKFAGFFILLQNVLLVCCLALLGIGILTPKGLLYIFIIKFSIDLLLIQKAANFFDQKHHLKHYLLASLYYPFFSVYVAFIAVFKGYKWKGRSYRQ
ncbi:MAG: glycosyltransferase, partial [Gelidibacter sp.]